MHQVPGLRPGGLQLQRPAPACRRRACKARKTAPCSGTRPGTARNLAVDTRTQTAYGTLRTYINFNIDNELGADTAQATRAFIQWGGFTFGRTASFTDHEGSLGDSGFRSLYTGLVDATTGAAGINQIAYTWQLGNGITFNVGADERRVAGRSRNVAR